MFSSTIIPTVGRDSLARAVDSVLSSHGSDFDFEIIVVNDSGNALPPAAWQPTERVRVIQTNCRERSVARNTGAAVARGRYLHFLDDDDWMLPGALGHFWALAQSTQAGWLYGSTRLVNRQGEAIIELHHGLNGNCFTQVMAGEWIPLQSSLIRADLFFELGGFDPRLAGPEDIDLCRRAALVTDFASMDTLVACVGMGAEGGTTDFASHPRASRRARERILDMPRVFPRLRASAHSSYWRGRVVRVYLTSLLWNVKERRAFTAASRGVFALASIVLALPSLFAPNFWRALLKPYDSPTFLRGFREANRPVERRKVM